MASTKAMSLGSQLVWLVVRICEADPLLRIGWIGKIYRTIIPSNRSPLEAFADLKVAGGDLLEGAGIVFTPQTYGCRHLSPIPSTQQTQRSQ